MCKDQDQELTACAVNGSRGRAAIDLQIGQPAERAWRLDTRPPRPVR